MTEFGRDYTDRNSLTAEGVNSLWQKNYGVTREDLNKRFLADIPHDAKILEVGCNMGNQLLLLQEKGFQNLHGIEVQQYALTRARSRLPNVRLAQATAFDIPYPDNYFDVVFTSGVLIHIAPNDLLKALKEIHRCAKIYIWGTEYYSPETQEIKYRGQDGLLWKMDYAALYLKHFVDLELVRTERLPYLQDSNVDCMFLLRKVNSLSLGSAKQR